MTTRSLHLAKNLTLPLDAVSRTFGILAVRGAGKSNTAAVMAEEMFAAGLPFVVVDPVGSWYGLRSSADGTAPALPIPIFGGKHGDVPLERGAGELLADLIVEKRLTCVLDLSRFESESAKKQFLLAFAQRLYLKNENPLHLFLEEADDYIPQKPMRDEAQLLRAWENIVRRGRARGLGMTLITQRSAAVAKMVLTQVETLFAMRTTGPQDIAAIEAWVKYHQVGKDVLSTLAGLEDGEAWVWSPHYLKTMTRHQIRRRQTFDSGATPANVKAKDTRPPATLADIDLTSLQQRMAATIEKAKADDPRELRRQLADVRGQLAKSQAVTPSSQQASKVSVQPVLTDADRALLGKVYTKLGDLAVSLTATVSVDVAALVDSMVRGIRSFSADYHAEQCAARDEFLRIIDSKSVQKVFAKLSTLNSEPSINPAIRPVRSTPQPLHPQGRPEPGRRAVPAVTASRPTSGNLDVSLGKCERAILTVLAQQPDGCTAGRLTLLTCYRYSGGFMNSLTKLRTSGLMVGENMGTMQITDAGSAAIGDVGPLPVGDDLARHWLAHPSFGKCERAVLSALLEHPNGLTADRLCELTNYQYSGGFMNSLTKLRTAGVLVGKNTEVMKASEELFS